MGYCLWRRALIIPIRLGVDPYGFIARYEALSGVEKTPEELTATIFDILVDHELTASEMASALVSYFTTSDSYNETRRRMPLVERIKAWTPELLQRLEASVDQNGDIRDCFHMPDRVRALVKRHSGRE